MTPNTDNIEVAFYIGSHDAPVDCAICGTQIERVVGPVCVCLPESMEKFVCDDCAQKCAPEIMKMIKEIRIEVAEMEARNN